MVSDIESLQRHVEQLEHRLDEYHLRLTEAVRVRDETALDAAWGIVQALMNLRALVFGFVIGLVTYDLAKSVVSNTISLVLGGLVWFFAQWFLESRWALKVQSERIKEKDGLAPLPEWKNESWKLTD